MNYFELCNEILSELYYDDVDNFSELEEIEEGKRVKRLLNRALISICNNESEAWRFKERDKVLIPVENTAKYDRPNGYIRYIKYPKSNLVLQFFDEHKNIPSYTTGKPVGYWMDANEIRLFPIPNTTYNDDVLHIHYYTYDCAIDCCGLDKKKMVYETDRPIIPENHHDILVYKVCSDWRASANDAQSAFYKQEYKRAYKAMLDDCRQTEDMDNGLHLGQTSMSFTEQALYNFYNPYTVGRFNKGNTNG